MYNWLGDCAAYRRAQRTPGYLVAIVALVIVSALTYKVTPPAYVLGQTLANVGCLLLLDYVVREPLSYTGRWLNTSIVRAIGRGSYSIYLWQELFLANGRSSLDFAWPWNILGVATASLASTIASRSHFSASARSSGDHSGEYQPGWSGFLQSRQSCFTRSKYWRSRCSSSRQTAPRRRPASRKPAFSRTRRDGTLSSIIQA